MPIIKLRTSLWIIAGRWMVLLVTGMLVTACSAPPPPPAPAKVVRTLKVGSGDTANSRIYPGDVRARYETALAFRTGGKLLERSVDAGSVVKAGQVLARLDATDAAFQVSSANAQRDLAAADLARFRDLKAKNFISQAALDQREASMKTATAQAGLAKNQSAYAELNTDKAGVVVAVSAEVGQVVSAGQQIIRLAADGEREVAISIPEAELSRFKTGMPATISLWSKPPTPKENGAESELMSGRLREISPAADPVTRTYAARVSLQQADARIPLGLSATVRFPDLESAQHGVSIPLAAVFQQGDQPAVWIVASDNVVSLRKVTLLGMSANDALVGAGLSAGDVIVAAGVNQLVAGEKVRLATPAR